MIIVYLIKELMYQQNKTITDMVSESGLPYEIIENIIIQGVAPTPKEAEKIFRCLGFTLDEVLCLY